MKTLFIVCLDFVPLIAALFIKPLFVGFTLALVVTVCYIFQQLKTRRIRIVSVVNGIYFIVAFFSMVIHPDSTILSYAQPSIYLVLTTSTVLSLFISDPFTMQYAKESTPEALWKHPIFILINRRLTGVWAILFFLSSLFAIMMSLGFIGNVIGTIVTNVWNVVGIVAMLILPDRLQVHYLEKFEPEIPEDLAWNPEIAAERPTSAIVFDVIVVGSGIGGLVAALELASKGAKVLVLEQHYAIGGACTTYKRKGRFKFDAGVESISGLGDHGPVRNLLKRHGLEGKINWIQNKYEFRSQNDRTVIPQDYASWQLLLIRQFPQEESEIRSLFQEIKAAYEEKYSVFAPERITPNLPKTAKDKLQFAKQYPHYFKWKFTTWHEFLDAFVHDESLKNQMSILTGYVGDKKGKTSTDIMISLMGYFIDGGFRPEGGSGRFAKVLAEKLKDYGGEIHAFTPVESICVENQHVTGVRTKKGTYFSTIVISDACPRTTYEKLIGLSYISESYRKKVKALEPSMSMFVWTAAIRRPFCCDHLIHYHLSRPIALSMFGIVISEAGIYSASALDSSLAPSGHGTVTINLETKPIASALSAMTNESYVAFKAEVDRICLLILKEIDSDAAECILFSEVATPKTIAHYLRTYEGSIYSIKRNNLNDFPHIKAPIQGLYFTGAGTAYGPGIEAVVISGGAAAEEINFPVRPDMSEKGCIEEKGRIES